MRIATLLDPEVSLRDLERRIGPEIEWFDSYVTRALEKLGHEVVVIRHQDDIRITIEALHSAQPNLVFNLAMHARGLEEWCGHIPALLDLLGYRYTGSGPHAHVLSGNKATAKRIVRGAGYRTPAFDVVRVGSARPRNKLRFPVIVKLLCSGGSTGMSKASLCTRQATLERRISALHRRYDADVICEEFVEGTEVSVTLIGNGRLVALPLFEAVFSSGANALRFLTERVKWNDSHRKKVGVAYRRAVLDDDVEARVLDVSKKIYRLFEFQDYGNLDLRIAPDGEIFFIDGNANPGLRPVSPKIGAPPFEESIKWIIRSALARHRDWRRALHP